MEEKRKVLLSIQNLTVKFRVRGRVLTAIRDVSLDIYENESIAIVGESGSGKSVLTKTFAGMTDSNGFVDQGKIIFDDPELAETYVNMTAGARSMTARTLTQLNEYSRYELGAETYRQIMELESEKKRRASLTDEEREAIEGELRDLKFKRTNLFNEKQTYDPKNEKDRIRAAEQKLKEYDGQIKTLEGKEAAELKKRQEEAARDTAFNEHYNQQMAELKAKYDKQIAG